LEWLFVGVYSLHLKDWTPGGTKSIYDSLLVIKKTGESKGTEDNQIFIWL
jgi:hypothetical protein